MKNSLLHKLAQLFGIISSNLIEPSKAAGSVSQRLSSLHKDPSHSIHHHDKDYWDNKTEINRHSHEHIHPIKGKETSLTIRKQSAAATVVPLHLNINHPLVKMDPTQPTAKRNSAKQNNINRSIDQADDAEDLRPFLENVSKPSKDWILESLCRNLREVTKNNPKKLLQLKEQMHKMLQQLDSSRDNCNR